MKKLLLLSLLLISACSKPKQSAPQIEKSKFEAAYRAGKKVEAGTAVSVTLPEFRNLIQSFAAEISIAKDKAVTGEEKDLANLYEEAGKAYSASLSFWDASIQPIQNLGDALGCVGDIYAVAVKYKMECLEYKGVPSVPKDSIQYLWAVAHDNLNRANSLYLGSPQVQEGGKAETIKEALYDPFRLLVQKDHAMRQQAAEARAAENAKQQQQIALLKKKAENLVKPCLEFPGKWCWFDPDSTSSTGGTDFPTKEAAIKDAQKKLVYDLLLYRDTETLERELRKIGN